jgi:hypothetical protein
MLTLPRPEKSRAFTVEPRRLATDHVEEFQPVRLSVALGAAAGVLRARGRRPDYAEGHAGG